MLVAFSSPVKFSTIVFPVWNFVQSLKLCYKTFFFSVVANHSKLTFFHRKLSSRKRGNSWSVFHRNLLKYSNDKRAKLDCNWFFLLELCGERNTGTRHYSVELQTTKQTLATSKHSIEFTYSDFPNRLQVNRNKLALINRRSVEL